MDVKEIWTDSEFDDLGWHDCRLYAIKFPDENLKLSFDIDYIFKWEKVSEHFKFWVAPCDLVFSDVLGLKINMDYKDSIPMYISEVKRSNPRISPNGKVTIWDYFIECDIGQIFFSSTGFQQKIRSQPVLSESQDLKESRKS